MNEKGRDDAIHGETQQVEAVALLPADAVRDLTIKAAQRGVPAPQFLGIQALRGAYGALHPDASRLGWPRPRSRARPVSAEACRPDGADRRQSAERWPPGCRRGMGDFAHVARRGQDRRVDAGDGRGVRGLPASSRRRRRGWRAHGVYLPHDAAHKRLGTGFKNNSVQDMLRDLGVTDSFIVPRIDDVTVGINQTRMAMSLACFDEEHCKEGLDHLEKYSKEWDERAGTWKDYPKHDAHSNGADALRQWGQVHKNLRGPKPPSAPVEIPRTVSHWNNRR